VTDTDKKESSGNESAKSAPSEKDDIATKDELPSGKGEAKDKGKTEDLREDK